MNRAAGAGVNHETLSWLDRTRRLSERVRHLLDDEVTYLRPAKLAAELSTAPLPHLTFNFLRTAIWRVAGLRLGQRSRIMGPLHITGDDAWQTRLVIGDDTFLTGPIRIDLGADVHIGNRVHIGHDAMLLTVDHEIGNSELRCAATHAQPIHIGDGAWLAARCLVLPGVTIGKGAVVAAGAVVTRDVPPDTLVAGVPARVVRPLTEAELFGAHDASPESGLRSLGQANALTSRSPALRALS